jgi:hypothetical protein
MKGIVAIIALLAITISSPAAPSPLVGEPFVIGNIPIEWHATNAYRTLWVYKVIPQNFSSSVISNALVACSFKSLDMLATGDKGVLRFQDHKREEQVTRYLEISAASGWIEYSDMREPTNVTASIRGVPDANETERLGLDLLFRLGIDRTQFTPGPHSGGSKGISKILPSGQEQYIGVQTRHVTFVRQIDGFSFTGSGLGGGCWVEFGAHGVLRQFDLVWRNLLPYELRRVASDGQLLEYIKSGKAVHSTDLNLRSAKKFTIKSVVPEYLGAPGSEPQEFVYPIASMKIEAEFLTNKVDFGIACPILAPDSPSSKRP